MFKQATLATALSAALIAAAPAANAATVLTLEGGLVGMQHLLHFTPRQLRGDLCQSPNTCQPVDYSAFPAQPFTDGGATNVEKAIGALPAGEPVVLFGHSQGGQVIYSDLRRWAADPGSAPDPATVSWVSIGNPENRYGGQTAEDRRGEQPVASGRHRLPRHRGHSAVRRLGRLARRFHQPDRGGQCRRSGCSPPTPTTGTSTSTTRATCATHRTCPAAARAT